MSNQNSKPKNAFLKLLPSAEPIETTVKSSQKQAAGPAPDKPKERGFDAFWPVVAADPLYWCADGTEYINRNGRLFWLTSKNRELIEDLRLAGLDHIGKVPSRETIITTIDLLCAMARRDGKLVELFTRCGERGGKYYFDLANGKAVEVAPMQWRVVDAPVMFKRMRHQQPQAEPLQKDGNISRMLDFCRVSKEQQLLFLVTLVTCFIPRIAHPIVFVTGSQGGGQVLLPQAVEVVD